MRSLAFGLQLLLQVLAASADCVPRGDGSLTGLAPLLSKNAVVTFPSSSNWDNLTIRASSPRISPDYAAIVQVATESDVQHVIKFANAAKLPYLTVSGTHGWPSTLDNLKSGIQINMRKLNSIALSADGNTATLGGGAMQYEIVTALAAKGKQAVHGVCACVSGIGPLLGGGHSLLQGQHGFAADNLVSARVVLANASVVTVSATQNADLFWGIRGAGHNFGIITSYQVNAYTIPKGSWTMVAFSYTQDKLESFFNTWNKVEADNDDTGTVVLNGVMNRNDDVDPNHACLNLQVLFDVNDTVAVNYVNAFRALKPTVDVTVPNIAYADLYETGGFGVDSEVCRKNQNILGYPNSFAQWNPAGMRKGFTLFDTLTSDDTFSGAAWLLESYGRKGVQAVSEEANAVAPEERQRHLLTSPMLWWVGDAAADKAKAISYGQQMQKAIRASTDVPHSYVNYSPGGEPLVQTYGTEAGRVQKLQALKKKWDPTNQFGFYNPIQ